MSDVFFPVIGITQPLTLQQIPQSLQRCDSRYLVHRGCPPGSQGSRQEMGSCGSSLNADPCVERDFLMAHNCTELRADCIIHCGEVRIALSSKRVFHTLVWAFSGAGIRDVFHTACCLRQQRLRRYSCTPLTRGWPIKKANLSIELIDR